VRFTTWPLLFAFADQRELEVRLVGGTESAGRLEAWAFDAYRPVCPNNFEDLDATVACRVLGFRYVSVCATITMIK